MSSIKSLVGKKMVKKVKFMDQDIEIQKLSTQDIFAIQDLVKEIEGDETKGLEVMKTVIRAGTVGGQDLTDDDFAQWPLDELGSLQATVLKFSGVNTEGNAS